MEQKKINKIFNQLYYHLIFFILNRKITDLIYISPSSKIIINFFLLEKKKRS